MNKIGVIFAEEAEIEALRKYLNITNEYDIFDLKFYEGNINNVNCVLVRCGIGKVNAARTTQILIDNMNVDAIFNIGVAGGVDSSLSIASVVIGERLVQHDFDLTAFNYKKGYIPSVQSEYIESDSYFVSLAKRAFENLNEPVFLGVIASGDIFCTDIKMSQKINTKFNALCTEMEGASVAQVCFQSHIPFLVIRSISDIPNNENAVVYEEFLELSSVKVAEIMNELIKLMSEENN